MFLLIKDLENALNCLQREDPSLKVRVDPDSGQVGASDGGETGPCLLTRLHTVCRFLRPPRRSCAGWESCTSRSCTIASDGSTASRPTWARFRWPTGRASSTRPRPQVCTRHLLIHLFRSLLNSSPRCDADTLDRTIGDRRHLVTAQVSVQPADILSAGGSCHVAFTEELESQLSAEAKEAVENGARSSYLQGIIRDEEKTVQNSDLYYIIILTSRLPPQVRCLAILSWECLH